MVIKIDAQGTAFAEQKQQEKTRGRGWKDHRQSQDGIHHRPDATFSSHDPARRQNPEDKAEQGCHNARLQRYKEGTPVQGL